MPRISLPSGEKKSRRKESKDFFFRKNAKRKLKNARKRIKIQKVLKHFLEKFKNVVRGKR